MGLTVTFTAPWIARMLTQAPVPTFFCSFAPGIARANACSFRDWPLAIEPAPVSRTVPIVNHVERRPSSERSVAPVIVFAAGGPERVAVATRLELFRAVTTKSTIEFGARLPRARLSAAAVQTQSRPALGQSLSASVGPQLWWGEMLSCASGTLTRYGIAGGPHSSRRDAVLPPDVEW